MTCFITHFPLSVLSVVSLLVVLATLNFVDYLNARRPQLQTLTLSTASPLVRLKLRRVL